MVIDFFFPVADGGEKETRERLSALLRVMDAEGIGRVCLSGAGARYGEADAAAVAAAVEAHPDRFVGLGFLQLGMDGPAKVADYASRGFRGLRTCAPPAPYDEDAFMPVYEKACALGLPIHFQTGTDSRQRWDKAYWDRIGHENPSYLDRIARTFPQLGLVASLNAPGVRHSSQWLWNELQFLAHDRGYANLFFETSACGLAPEHPWSTTFLEHAIWASGGPADQVAAKLQGLRADLETARVPLTHEIWRPRELILGGNAAKLLHLKE